ncbi:hypothetical protein GCM10023160_05810 [Brachybacterium paraconglomeratum]
MSTLLNCGVHSVASTSQLSWLTTATPAQGWLATTNTYSRFTVTRSRRGPVVPIEAVAGPRRHDRWSPKARFRISHAYKYSVRFDAAAVWVRVDGQLDGEAQFPVACEVRAPPDGIAGNFDFRTPGQRGSV